MQALAKARERQGQLMQQRERITRGMLVSPALFSVHDVDDLRLQAVPTSRPGTPSEGAPDHPLCVQAVSNNPSPSLAAQVQVLQAAEQLTSNALEIAALHQDFVRDTCVKVRASLADALAC